MTDDKLFFVNRQAREQPLEDDRLKMYWRRAAHEVMGTKYVNIPQDTYSELVANYEVMLEFIKEAMPHMGLDIPADAKLNHELVRNLTTAIRKHNRKKKK